MSDLVIKPAATTPIPAASVQDVSILSIFLEFLFIGATSFGGGVVAYLRDGLVDEARLGAATRSSSNTWPSAKACPA